MEIMADSVKRSTAAISKRRTLLSIATLVTVVLVVAVIWGKRSDSVDYITGRVDRGNVDVIVSATGTVQPVTTVEIGSQVSGTVSWLCADFKSRVRRGQVLAKLDSAILQAQVDNQQAALANAQAGVQAATTDIHDQDASLIAAKANQDAARVARDDAIDLVGRDRDLKDVVASRDIEAVRPRRMPPMRVTSRQPLKSGRPRPRSGRPKQSLTRPRRVSHRLRLNSIRLRSILVTRS